MTLFTVIFVNLEKGESPISPTLLSEEEMWDRIEKGRFTHNTPVAEKLFGDVEEMIVRWAVPNDRIPVIAEYEKINEDQYRIIAVTDLRLQEKTKYDIQPPLDFHVVNRYIQPSLQIKNSTPGASTKGEEKEVPKNNEDDRVAIQKAYKNNAKNAFLAEDKNEKREPVLEKKSSVQINHSTLDASTPHQEKAQDKSASSHAKPIDKSATQEIQEAYEKNPFDTFLPGAKPVPEKKFREPVKLSEEQMKKPKPVKESKPGFFQTVLSWKDKLMSEKNAEKEKNQPDDRKPGSSPGRK